jgi:hypothetical protein
LGENELEEGTGTGTDPREQLYRERKRDRTDGKSNSFRKEKEVW